MEEIVIVSIPISEYKDIVSLIQQRDRQREAKRQYYRSRKGNVDCREPYSKDGSNMKVLQILQPQTYVHYYPQQPTLEIINDTSQQYQHTNSQQTNVLTNVGVPQLTSN